LIGEDPESEFGTLVDETSESGDFYDVESGSGYEDSDEDTSGSDSTSNDDDFVIVSRDVEEREEEILLVDASERAMLSAWNGRTRRGSVYPRSGD